MSKKLFTLEELSQYLGIRESKISELVDKGVISGYKLAGEYLRFRREQIDAIRSEIEARVTAEDKMVVEKQDAVRGKEKLVLARDREDRSIGTTRERLADFFYFNDFYIFCGILIAALVLVIFRG
ncbi:MAG: excisionase family DNA-binding protein [Candidatus Omnitrophica bacterium]|nr:excisionase family DNA-binding protein [Candidatus Omnitrophota bacterium]MDD5488411.1 excisionase family DNA-binding protein [Candidatus Omnitrophota bacterium]